MEGRQLPGYRLREDVTIIAMHYFERLPQIVGLFLGFMLMAGIFSMLDYVLSTYV
jgi:hypothetical protein